MVSLKRKQRGSKTYYYLEISVREGNKVKKMEKYLGQKFPKNLQELKTEFLREFLSKKYFPVLNKIKKNYQKEKKKTPKSALEKNLENLSIHFTYNTNAIEGSTLTLRETALLLEKGIVPKEKPFREIKEAEAHKKVFYKTLSYRKNLNLQIVLYWHKLLFKETKPDLAGKIRQHSVLIAGSRFKPPYPAELNFLLEDFFKWRQKNKLHPVELAALVHLKFVSIHPFSDGNGRISRLMMNFVLNKFGYPIFVISYENRNSYYNALEKAQIGKDDYIFVRWFIKRYLKEWKDYL